MQFNPKSICKLYLSKIKFISYFIIIIYLIFIKLLENKYDINKKKLRIIILNNYKKYINNI